ncbi:transcriptional regulator [Candidatus Bathyarchaeota archaeon CG07_land_8_20_14_0_80_47_9]|jgi:predicted DNA-binding transcriptional regulator|nr:MAG: transcriptional regulator [Candidatus Bathyarchaeota archaeon CG07_land_8_20_14_0_80_47_9]
MSKDQAIGMLIFLACAVIAILYTVGLFLPIFEGFGFWIVAIPVFIGFIAILGIGAWIGWTMATTPPPKPIDDVATEKIEETTENK